MNPEKNSLKSEVKIHINFCNKKENELKKTKPLEHWKDLKLGRKREFEGNFYDKSIVKRVYPDEVYGWEHTKTTPVLMEIAKNNAWEDFVIPPILLLHTPDKNSTGRQYAVYDGHHRLNAALKSNLRRAKGADLVGVPAMVVGTWSNESGSFFGYNNCPLPSIDERNNQKWNPKNMPQKVFVIEGITEKNIWGTKELEVILKGNKMDNNITQLTSILNKFKKPNEFLQEGKDDILRIRISTDNARQESFSRVYRKDIQIKINDLKTNDWSKLLSNTQSFRELLGVPKNNNNCPILNVQIQQSKYSFITDGY